MFPKTAADLPQKTPIVEYGTRSLRTTLARKSNFAHLWRQEGIIYLRIALADSQA
jgi:hypothetical protein